MYSFHFTARFGLRGAAPEQRDRAQLDPLRDLPILMVDDNTTNRRIFEAMLGNWGMTPTVASGACEAMAALDQARCAGAPFRVIFFDVILMDVRMPAVDGYTAMKQIRRLEKTIGKRTPIIAVTANAMKGDQD